VAAELFQISISVTLLVLCAILVAQLAAIGRSLAALAELLRDLRRETTPMIADLRTISRHAVYLSESLRTGVDGVGRMGKAVGNIGDDLEEGRRSVKGGLKLLGTLFGPWLAKFKS
jgi:hypothetical protein